MILQVLFWRLLGCWFVAAVVAMLEVLPAYARGATLAQSSRSAARICVRYGVVLTIGIAFIAAFDGIERIWDFSLKPFSDGLAGYSEYVRHAVHFAFWICFMIVISPVVRLSDRFVPRDDRTPAAEVGTDGSITNGN